MPDITKELTIDASPDTVWRILGPGFARIGDWATAIPASAALIAVSERSRIRIDGIAAAADAPVAGRVCKTGLRMVPQVTEMLVAYDDANRTLTYHASGMPSFVTTARNTWTVTPLTEQQCNVR
jgi:hypothetical protein